MLVLGRSEGEKILIQTPSGTTLEFTILKLDRKRARVGIEAPKEYRILRSEVLDRILLEAAEAESDE